MASAIRSSRVEWQSSYTKASEDILPLLGERRMVGGEGIEPPTLSV